MSAVAIEFAVYRNRIITLCVDVPPAESAANALFGRFVGVSSAYQRRNSFFRRWYTLAAPPHSSRDALACALPIRAGGKKCLPHWEKRGPEKSPFHWRVEEAS